MRTRDRDREPSEFLPPVNHVKAGGHELFFYMGRVYVRRLRKSVGQEPSVDVRNEPPEMDALSADERDPVKRHLVDKGKEGRLQALHVFEEFHMLPVYVRYNRYGW